MSTSALLAFRQEHNQIRAKPVNYTNNKNCQILRQPVPLPGNTFYKLDKNKTKNQDFQRNYKKTVTTFVMFCIKMFWNVLITQSIVLK